jgi:hypothetical protein
LPDRLRASPVVVVVVSLSTHRARARHDLYILFHFSRLRASRNRRCIPSRASSRHIAREITSRYARVASHRITHVFGADPASVEPL